MSAGVSGVSRRSYLKESNQKMQDFKSQLRNIDKWLDQKESSIDFNSQFNSYSDNPELRNLNNNGLKMRGEYLIEAGYKVHRLISGVLK